MQHAAWVIAPLVLVCVLTFSAVAKVGKGASLRKIIRNLRLPQWLLPEPLARMIPAIELALVAGMLAPWVPVFRGAAAATLLLMLIYWALIARGLTITPRPECGCFGQAGDHQISGRTLMRNTALVSAAAATLGLAASGRTVWSLISEFTVNDSLWLGLTALACLVTGLVLGRFGSSSASDAPMFLEQSKASTQHEYDDDADYVRSPTPELLLHDRDSGPITLIELSATRAQLLVFVNCYCASTLDVMAALEGWRERLDLLDVHMVFSVPIVDKLLPILPPGTLVDHRGLVWRALALTGSPNALLLGVDGFLAGGPVSGPEEVKAFIDEVQDSLRGAPAPAADDIGQAERVSQPLGQLNGDR